MCDLFVLLVPMIVLGQGSGATVVRLLGCMYAVGCKQDELVIRSWLQEGV